MYKIAEAGMAKEVLEGICEKQSVSSWEDGVQMVVKEQQKEENA
jgi:hypothetical protein